MPLLPSISGTLHREAKPFSSHFSHYKLDNRYVLVIPFDSSTLHTHTNTQGSNNALVLSGSQIQSQAGGFERSLEYLHALSSAHSC